MPASTREVYLLLRARDEASRVLRGFSAELMQSAARMQAAMLRNEAINKRNAAAAERAAAALVRQRIAQMQAEGATQAAIAGQKAIIAQHMARARALQNEANALDQQARLTLINDANTRRLTQSVTTMAASIETLGISMALTGGFSLSFFFNASKGWQEYQRQVALTHTQVDGFTTSLEELADVAIDIGRRIPVAFEQIQPALFDIFSSTDANLKQARILLEGFSKAAVAGQTDIQTAARGTIAIMNAYNIPLERVNEVLDIQFELVRKGVGTYAEFSAVFGRVVPSATRAGQSFETVAAMLAFMTRNGQSAAMAATSAARALEAMTHPSTVKRLEEMGVKARDAQGNFLPLVDILTQLRERILKLPPADRVKALFELFKSAGGTIQARRFLEQILLREGELENFRDLLLSMGNASGVMEQKFSEMADTAAGKMQLLSNRWQALKMAIGEAATPELMRIVDMLSTLVEWFNNLDPRIKNTITSFLVWGSVLGIVAGAIFILLGLLAGVVTAFVLAGTEILIVTGILFGIGAVLFSVAGAFAVLWSKSKEFRDGLSSLKQAIQDFWDNAAKPAFETLSKIWREKVQPILERGVDLMGKSLKEAFEATADAIEEDLIPAVQDVIQWYKDHEEEVNRAIDAIDKLIEGVQKAGAALTRVFGSAFGKAIIGSIVGFIYIVLFAVSSFVNAVNTISAMVAFFEKAWNISWTAVKNFFVQTWNSITSFFTGIWNGIVSVFNTAWNNFMGMVNAALGFLRGLWENFWSMFGTPIKAAWELVQALVELGITLIIFVVSWGLAIVAAIWNTTWTIISNTAKTVWNAITTFFKTIWNAIVTAFRTVWEGVVAVWNAIWDRIGGRVTSTGNSIRNFLSGAWNAISTTARNAWNNFYSIISTALERARSTVTSVWDNIRNFFAGAGNWLYDAGRRIIQGLINGITSMLQNVTNAIRGITQRIRDHLPFSPAKEGPLSGRGNPFFSGQSIATLLAQGMLSRTDLIAAAARRLAEEVAFNPAGPSGFAASTAIAGGPLPSAPVVVAVQGGPPSKQINITQHITTQEIDPRVHAEQLGWELAGRL